MIRSEDVPIFCVNTVILDVIRYILIFSVLQIAYSGYPDHTLFFLNKRKTALSANVFENYYRIYPKYWDRHKYWDRQACAISVDPDQTPQKAASDLGLHCLPQIQHTLDTSTWSIKDSFDFTNIYIYI